MGGFAIDFHVVADTASALRQFVIVFSLVYGLLILVYILMSWFRLPYSPTLERAQRFLYDVCDPYLKLFRRFIPPFGPIDLSPMVALITLSVVSRLLIWAIDRAL
jgi:YggT family protein